MAGRLWQTLQTILAGGSSVPALRLAAVLESLPPVSHPYFNGSTRPYARWWWLRGPFREADLAAQLDWTRDHGFGGVELAWLDPGWLEPGPPPPAWLSREWSDIVLVASRLARERGLGCDFTFGSCWPFGGSHVAPESAAQTFEGCSTQRLRGSWEESQGRVCRVMNHLSSQALAAYAQPLLAALAPALRRQSSALFCDSLEIHTEDLWDRALWDDFDRRSGYRLEPFVDTLEANPDVRYDYRKLIAGTMTRELYAAFTATARSAGVYSRAQCHGSPTDLLAAYGAVDIPESEALLYEPTFSRIPASAAALTGKPIVSAETFTCIYGFSHHRDPNLCSLWQREDAGDLRLLADSIVAHGVNQIVWHGMPCNPVGGTNEFYAAVHVGPEAGFSGALPGFNRYLANLCRVMQAGSPLSQVAVYLPLEDNWMAGEIPPEERIPGATHRWQLRHVVVPPETEGYHPLWVSMSSLEDAAVRDGALVVGSAVFAALYIDVEWLDHGALVNALRLARAGATVILKRRPAEPGHRRHHDYEALLDSLGSLPNVLPSLRSTAIRPFVAGEVLPHYWARRTGEALYVFLAHPEARNVRYPMRYRQSREARSRSLELRFSWGAHERALTVPFVGQSSVLLRLGRDGDVGIIEHEPGD